MLDPPTPSGTWRGQEVGRGWEDREGAQNMVHSQLPQQNNTGMHGDMKVIVY